MRDVLSGRLPDRVPFFPTIYTDHACVACGHRFRDALVDPALGQECMLNAALRYGADAVRFCMGPPAAWYQQKVVLPREGRLVQCSRRSGEIEGHYDLEGGGRFIAAGEPRPTVASLSDVRAMRVTGADEYLQQGCMKDVARLARRAHEHSLFVVGMCSSQTVNFMVEQLGSAETALMLFYDDPRLACAIIDKAVAISIEKGTAFVRSGVDCLYVGDSYASASVISPDVYRRFCAPAYAEVAREFHAQGVFCYKHCCGNYDPLLEDLAAIGVDAMDGIDPESGMSVGRTKRQVGASLTLMGGVSCLTLLEGTRQEVFDAAAKCVAEGKPGGRYVLGSACAVPRYAPAENLIAARDAALQYGRYPGRRRGS
jgi:uroporphyrinogen-III decarboxylase